MKFKGASGDFLYGQDEEEMPYGSLFAANINDSKWEWSFWWEGEVLKTESVKVVANARAFEQEPDYLPEDYDGDMSLEEIRVEQADKKSSFMDGWSCQAVLDMRLVGGPAIDDPESDLAFGEEFTIKLNNGVALSQFRALLGSYGRQFRFKEGLLPIIDISAKSYVSKVKSVGKRYTPVFKITDWKSDEELMGMDGAGDDPDMYDAPETDKEETEASQEDSADSGETAPRGPGARRVEAHFLNVTYSQVSCTPCHRHRFVSPN